MASSSAEGADSASGGAGARGLAWEAELAAELAAGEGPVMAALEGYLRSDQGSCEAPVQ